MRKNSWKQVKLQKYLLIKVVQKNFKKRHSGKMLKYNFIQNIIKICIYLLTPNRDMYLKNE